MTDAKHEAPAEGAGKYLNPGDLFWGVCRAFNTAANAASVLRSNPEKIGLVIDALDGLKGEMDSVINDPSDPLRARSSAPEAREGEAWPERWSGPCTVGNMISNLRTLPPEMPLYSAYHIPMNDQPSLLKVKRPTLSRERVDGTNIKTGDESIPYSAVIWAQPRDPEEAHPAAPSADKLRIADGARHTALTERIREDLICQHSDAFTEGDGSELIIPSGCTPQSAFVKIDVSALADVALAALKAEGGQ